MGMDICLVCEHCDPNRTNDLDQVRCKRFSTFVDALNSCNKFTTKKKITLTETINRQLRSEQGNNL